MSLFSSVFGFIVVLVVVFTVVFVVLPAVRDRKVVRGRSGKPLGSSSVLRECCVVFRCPESVSFWLDSVQRFLGVFFGFVVGVTLQGNIVRIVVSGGDNPHRAVRFLKR